MKIIGIQLTVPKTKLICLSSLKKYFEDNVVAEHPNSKAIRFIVTETLSESYKCEVDLLVFENDVDKKHFDDTKSIFDYSKRTFEDTEQFTSVLMIPTGIGAELGGHCGDGNVAARLLASACDTLITHPNVVNASDLNEMTENTLYVEGGTLTEFLNGTIGLQKVRSNRILMLMDKSDDEYFNNEIINAVSSARVTIGIDCDVLEMTDTVDSHLDYTGSGRATAQIENFENLLKTIKKYRNDYDAFGLATIVQIPEEDSREYFKSKEESVNPWGGSEAIITHSVGAAFGVPSAHSPLSLSMGDLHLEYDMGIVDPRKAPESASVSYLHCILKGLHKSPRIVNRNKGLNVESVSCLVTTDGCIGLPILACLEHNIPVIAVKNNNLMKNNLSSLPFRPGQLIYADNYIEAAGIMTALKAGVSLDTLQRPINLTTVL